MFQYSNYDQQPAVYFPINFVSSSPLSPPPAQATMVATSSMMPHMHHHFHHQQQQQHQHQQQEFMLCTLPPQDGSSFHSTAHSPMPFHESQALPSVPSSLQSTVNSGSSALTGVVHTPMASGDEPPCNHNNWDNLRAKHSVVTLCCRDCHRKWKQQFPICNLCPEFHSRLSCAFGVNCPFLHVHRFKSVQRSPNPPGHIVGSTRNATFAAIARDVLHKHPGSFASDVVSEVLQAYNATGSSSSTLLPVGISSGVTETTTSATVKQEPHHTFGNDTLSSVEALNDETAGAFGSSSDESDTESAEPLPERPRRASDVPVSICGASNRSLNPNSNSNNNNENNAFVTGPSLAARDRCNESGATTVASLPPPYFFATAPVAGQTPFTMVHGRTTHQPTTHPGVLMPTWMAAPSGFQPLVTMTPSGPSAVMHSTSSLANNYSVPNMMFSAPQQVVFMQQQQQQQIGGVLPQPGGWVPQPSPPQFSLAMQPVVPPPAVNGWSGSMFPFSMPSNSN